MRVTLSLVVFWPLLIAAFSLGYVVATLSAHREIEKLRVSLERLLAVE